MNFDDQTNKILDAYFNNELTADERVVFEAKMEANPDLAQAIVIHKKMQGFYNEDGWSLSNTDDKTLKEAELLFKTEEFKIFSDRLKTYHKNRDIGKTTISLKRYISIAAAVVFITLGGFYFFNTNTSTLELYDAYYSQKDLPSFIIQDVQENMLQKAENLYTNKKYVEALKLFETVKIEQEEYNANLNIYIAMCNLHLENYDATLSLLNTVQNSDAIDAHKAYCFKYSKLLNQ